MAADLPDDSVASAASQSVSGPADGIQETLRGLAETQRAHAIGREGSQTRLEEYSVVRAAKQYKLWKRLVCPVKCYHDLSDSELALLTLEQVKGTSKGPSGHPGG